jgi:putative PIN family toxin of toxin-antitoxin system
VRIFLDTNVLASSVATRGLCSEVLEGVLHDHDLLTCAPVFAELERVLLRKFRLPESVVAGFLALLRDEGVFIESRKAPSIRIKDPDDVAIVACALAGAADLFVTGDKALLDLKVIDGLVVVSAREMWTRLAGM